MTRVRGSADERIDRRDTRRGYAAGTAGTPRSTDVAQRDRARPVRLERSHVGSEAHCPREGVVTWPAYTSR